jgi:DNA-binding transcriptional regulator YhcF (GntR family)
MHTIRQSLLDSLSLAGGGAPIYVQLRDQILRALGEGRLSPGDQMPTMRQVAVALRIDLNTARRAYDELEALGVIRLERGRGSFVAQAPSPPDRTDYDRVLDDVARQAMGLAQARGVDPLTLARRIEALVETSKETLDG